MSRNLLASAILLAAITALCPPGSPAAAAPWHLDLRAGVYSEPSDPFIGGGLQRRLTPSGWSVNPNLEWVFVDNGELFTFNVDFLYDLRVDDAVEVWAGIGPAIVFRDRDRRDSQTDPGLNLLAGAAFNRGGAVHPFVQGKLLLSEDSGAVLAFGIRF